MQVVLVSNLRKTMQLTAELRWFYRGTLPKVVQWFQQCQPAKHLAPPEERLYLYSPECEYLGIKLRQGRLEMA